MTKSEKKERKARIGRALSEAAVKALQSVGYEIEKRPQRGRGAIWTLKRDGAEQVAVLRTSQDRFIAFAPVGEGWKPLDEVDVVVIAAVDDVDNPRNLEVYTMPADIVRETFKAAQAAKKSTGRAVTEGYGLWVPLDRHEKSNWQGFESLLLREGHEQLGTFPLDVGPVTQIVSAEPIPTSGSTETIADVLADARTRIARLSGVPFEQVSLNLQLGA